MACARSASRASPSTWPTAISRRRGGNSSSPIRPGHEQYTRNMATGASTADLAVILVDATHGLLSQTRRHALHRFAAGDSQCRGGDQQDGPGRLQRGCVPAAASGIFWQLASAAGHPERRSASRSARSREITSLTAARTCRGTTGPTLLEHLETVPRRGERSHESRAVSGAICASAGCGLSRICRAGGERNDPARR